MRNYLRENYAEAFSVQNQYAANAEGGIALWELPAQFQYAFNPIIFRRTHWFFRADGYEPTQEFKPNYISYDSDSRSLKLMYPAKSNLSVTCKRTSTGSTTTIDIKIGEELVAISSAATIISVAVYLNGNKGAYGDSAADNSYIYLIPTAKYIDDNFIADGVGKILYLATNEIDTSYLDVYQANGMPPAIKLAAESFNGITTFDVAAVVRTRFAEYLADSEAAIIADGRLSVQYTVKGVGGVGSVYDMVAINGVAQIGENSDRTADIGKVLTEYNRLVLYDGYELDYAILSATAIATPRGNSSAYAISRVKVYATDIEKNTHKIQIVSGCVPDQPFYIRWINRLGGVEYYMFARHQTFQPKVKSSSTYEVYVENPITARTNARAYTITTDNVVVVGADGVHEEQYKALANMPFSPTIEWYNEQLGQWVEITVSKFDGKCDSDTSSHDLEITFNLPTINTQF